MIPRYSCLLQNLATGRVTAELPIEEATAVESLNGIGSLKTTTPLRVDGVTADMVAPKRNAAFLLRDSAVVGSGIISNLSGDVAGNGLTLNCVGWHSYLNTQFLKVSQLFAGTDQATIVKWLVDYVSAKSGALQIGTTNIVATGVQRDRAWYTYERQNIGKLISDMADVIDGFNFRYRVTREEDGFTVELLLGYPATGRVTNYVFDMDSNVDLLSFTTDGTNLANSVDVLGAGERLLIPIASRVDVDVLATTPLYEDVERYTDVSEVATLDEKADRRLTLGRDPVTVPKLRLSFDAEPSFGSYVVGDRARVRGSYGVLDIDDDYVVQQTTLKVGPDAEYVDIDVAPVAALL